MALDSYLTPKESCERILHQVKSSNLHFILQESPYSVYLTVRKRFVGNAPKLIEPKVSMATETRNIHLEERIIELNEALKETEENLIKAESTVKILETKAGHAEKEVFQLSNTFKKEKEALVDENKILKQVIKTKNEEVTKKDKELSEVNRVLKSKNKEIQKLDQKQETFQQRIKVLKENSGKVKVEKDNAEKAFIKLEKRVKIDHEKLDAKVKDLKQKLLVKNSEPITSKSEPNSAASVTSSAKLFPASLNKSSLNHTSIDLSSLDKSSLDHTSIDPMSLDKSSLDGTSIDPKSDTRESYSCNNNNMDTTLLRTNMDMNTSSVTSSTEATRSELPKSQTSTVNQESASYTPDQEIKHLKELLVQLNDETQQRCLEFKNIMGNKSS